MDILIIVISIILLIYLIKFGVFLIKICLKKREMKKRPQGFLMQDKALWIDEMYTRKAKVRTFHELADPIEPVLEFWNDPSASEFTCFVGDSLNAKVKRSKENLKKRGIRRELIVRPFHVAESAKGKTLRKWDDGGREWQASEIICSVLESYYSMADDSLVSSYYYSFIYLTPLASRCLRANDKAEAHKRDKWGRKMKARSFYSDMRITICPSCGGELPKDLKDPVCPYCNSTMFSDYYDWQMEGIEFTPGEVEFHTFIDTLIWLFSSENIGCKVSFKHKYKGKKRVVRFSENAFYYDVYDSCMETIDQDNLIDLWLGKIKILKVTHTDKDTFLKIKVPVWSTLITDNGKVVKKKEIKKSTYGRTRYPNKFDKDSAVIANEKECPSCGGEYVVDNKGRCIHCGAFLFMDNSHWKESKDGDKSQFRTI